MLNGILERNRGDYLMSIYTGKIFKCAIRGETRKGTRRKEGVGVGGQGGETCSPLGREEPTGRGVAYGEMGERPERKEKR